MATNHLSLLMANDELWPSKNITIVTFYLMISESNGHTMRNRITLNSRVSNQLTSPAPALLLFN